MPSGPAVDAWSALASHVSQSPFRATSSNLDGGCPLNLTPSRRFCDSPMTQGFVRCGDPATQNLIPLALPVADAARPARPDLDPRIERLRIERIAVSPRQFGSRRRARFLRARVHGSGLVNSNFGSGLFGPGFRFRTFRLGFRFRTRLCAPAAAIGLCLDRNRLEIGGRTEPLRGKDRRGKG